MRRVFVTVGTDHHRFGRLMDWVQAQQDAGTATYVVQHGASRPVTGAVNHELLPHAELLAEMADADVIVAQGGPGTIMDARRVGHRPIVVPRLHALAEVVDDHQVSFCREMEQQGHAVVVEDRAAFDTALAAALAHPEALRVEPGASAVEATVTRIGTELDALLDRPRPAGAGALLGRLGGLARAVAQRLAQRLQPRSRPRSS